MVSHEIPFKNCKINYKRKDNLKFQKSMFQMQPKKVVTNARTTFFLLLELSK